MRAAVLLGSSGHVGDTMRPLQVGPSSPEDLHKAVDQLPPLSNILWELNGHDLSTLVGSHLSPAQSFVAPKTWQDTI